MKVIIIGAGIGGLVCAIACRQEGLSVTVLERTPALAPVSLLNPSDWQLLTWHEMIGRSWHPDSTQRCKSC